MDVQINKLDTVDKKEQEVMSDHSQLSASLRAQFNIPPDVKFSAAHLADIKKQEFEKLANKYRLPIATKKDMEQEADEYLHFLGLK